MDSTSEVEVKVDLSSLDSGESQAKSDELDYLIDGLLSGNVVARRASALGLVEAIATPHSRFLLRLSGGLPRLLAAMAVAETTSQDEVVTRLCLATIAITIIQDRANIEHISLGTVQGLLALASPLGDNEMGSGSCNSSSAGESSSSGASKGGGGGWRKKHALGGTKSNALSTQMGDEGKMVRDHLRGSARVAPYEAESVLPAELALLALQRALSGSKNSRSFQGASGQSQRQSLDLSSPTGLAVLVRIVTRKPQGWPQLHALELLEHASSQSAENQRVLSTDSLVASLVSLVDLEGPSTSSPPWPHDIVGAALRVLINLTHHNPPAVGMALKQGVVPPLLASLRQHNSKLEEGAAEWLLEEEGAHGEGDDAAGAHPSFDLSLLTMNALTNCVEISADARDLVANYTVVKEDDDDDEADDSHEGATIPFLASLVMRRAAAFKQELAEPLADQGLLEGSPSSHVDEDSEKEADAWPVEDLVVCGYASLLLGCLVRDRPENYSALEAALGQGAAVMLVRLLKAFTALQSSVGVLTAESAAPILALIEELQGQATPALPHVGEARRSEQHDNDPRPLLLRGSPPQRPSPPSLPASSSSSSSCCSMAVEENASRRKRPLPQIEEIVVGGSDEEGAEEVVEKSVAEKRRTSPPPSQAPVFPLKKSAAATARPARDVFDVFDDSSDDDCRTSAVNLSPLKRKSPLEASPGSAKTYGKKKLAKPSPSSSLRSTSARSSPASEAVSEPSSSSQDASIKGPLKSRRPRKPFVLVKNSSGICSAPD